MNIRHFKGDKHTEFTPRANNMPEPVRKDRAAGMIIYRRGANGVEYLLLQPLDELWNWGLPYVKITDSGERMLDAALRVVQEVLNLTRLQLEIHMKFWRETIIHCEGQPLFTTFWLSKFDESEQIILSDTYYSYSWVPLAEGLVIVDENNLRDLLLSAQSFLSKLKNIYPN